MHYYGKILGLIFGFLMAGPIGAVIGMVIGHVFDRGLKQTPFFSQVDPVHAQAIFFRATFTIMGYIAKADGRISEDEIRTARAIMSRLGLNQDQKQKAIAYFNLGKQADFAFENTLQELFQACQHYRALLQIFFEVQMQAAYADGINLSPHKRQLLITICQYLRIPAYNFAIFEHLYSHTQGQAYQQQKRYQSNQSPPKATSHLEDAYTLLGVSKTASMGEIKRAYRRLMSQNHPDKLMAKGLPEEMMKVATEKTQRIQAAYELICEART